MALALHRAEADDMIEAGKITVNGQVAPSLVHGFSNNDTILAGDNACSNIDRISVRIIQ